MRLALLVSLLVLATAPVASAATVSFDGATIKFTAAAGETNHVTVDQSGTSVTIGDSNPTTAPLTCSQDDAHTVTCPDVSAIAVDLGDRDDTLATSERVTIAETVDAGAGDDCDIRGGGANDVIRGGAGDDCLFGGAGADFVDGGSGADSVNGEAGDDRLSGGPGAPSAAALTSDPTLQDSGDVISGGSGIDEYDYVLDNNDDTATTVSLSLDGVANDGLPGENDNIGADVEDIAAQVSNPTTITGSAVTNAIYGSSGADTITPAAGNDFVFAGDGDDIIDAVDGFADRIDCGAGDDAVSVDEFDQVADNCETVRRTTLGALATEDRPPTIAWLSPAENSLMSTTAPNTLSVNATDDEGITQVVFLDGERVLCRVTAAPYTCAYSPIDADVGKDTLTAMVTDTSQQTASALRTVRVPRFTPSQVTSRTTPRRDRTAPFSFRTRGTVVLPPGVTRASGCHGVATVLFKAGRKTVSARNANLSRTCTFSRRVTFRIPIRLHPRMLKVEVRFRGNAVLKPRSALSRRVKLR